MKVYYARRKRVVHLPFVETTCAFFAFPESIDSMRMTRLEARRFRAILFHETVISLIRLYSKPLSKTCDFVETTYASCRPQSTPVAECGGLALERGVFIFCFSRLSRTVFRWRPPCFLVYALLFSSALILELVIFVETKLRNKFNVIYYLSIEGLRTAK